jgi:hypothetical protein
MYEIFGFAAMNRTTHAHEHWVGASVWAPSAPLSRVREYKQAFPRKAQPKKRPRRDVEIEALRQTVEGLTQALAEVQQLILVQQREAEARRARLEKLVGPLDGIDELPLGDVLITEEEFQAMSEYDD